MPTQQQSLEQQLQAFERLIEQLDQVVSGDPDAEQHRSRIQGLIGTIRRQLTQQGDGGTGAESASADLSRECAEAQRFHSAWQQALDEVASQVTNICRAIEPKCDQPAWAALHRALQQYCGRENVRREFPDLDLSKLVDAATADDRAQYEAILEQSAREVQQAREELRELRPLLNGLDNNPFGVACNADDTVTRVLEEIAAGLGV